ncbi:uncharacterized protein LOC131249563 [Magnolia sinica]|uniref:uncharacterized protein LOC131249563 n=1 Tax=Magnolia sinica TaxID=86752 RepID=UPI00265AFB83|nr:uncharacterized protein LOC131249563 [Magnolia sinica]
MVSDKGTVAEPLPPKVEYLVERIPFSKDARVECKQKNVFISLIHKVVVSTQPGNCAVMIIHGPNEELAFCRPGDKSWTALEPWDVFGTSPMAAEFHLCVPPRLYEKMYLRVNDHALFVGGNQSISYSASSFSNCKANCIYFCDDEWDVCVEESPPWGYDLGIFNLKDGSFDRYPGIESWVIMPQSIWFTPNPY